MEPEIDERAALPLGGSPGLRPFVDWYRVEYPRLVNVVARLVGDRELARDAAAEAFSLALERWENVGAMASPSGWTYRVAFNLARRQGRRLRLERMLLRRPAEPSITGDRTHELWDAVGRLPARQRAAVVLHYGLDISYDSVAEVMGVASGTVAATLAAARRNLAAALGDPTLGADDD